MDELIYRKDAIRVLNAKCNVFNLTCGKEGCACLEYTALRDLPSARKKGHWMFKREEHSTYTVEQAVCSECGEPCATYGLDKPRDRFCKWCGADMRGDESG